MMAVKQGIRQVRPRPNGPSLPTIANLSFNPAWSAASLFFPLARMPEPASNEMGQP